MTCAETAWASSAPAAAPIGSGRDSSAVAKITRRRLLPTLPSEVAADRPRNTSSRVSAIVSMTPVSALAPKAMPIRRPSTSTSTPMVTSRLV